MDYWKEDLVAGAVVGFEDAATGVVAGADSLVASAVEHHSWECQDPFQKAGWRCLTAKVGTEVTWKERSLSRGCW